MDQIQTYLRSNLRRKRDVLNAISGQLDDWLGENASRNESTDNIMGAIGTMDGRIWTVHRDKKVFSKAIIRREDDRRIFSPLASIQNLDKGPTGCHDIYINVSAEVELLYCHQSVAKIAGQGYVSLCGRTFVVYTEGDDCDVDDCFEVELQDKQHLQLRGGAIQVRVSAAGHRVFVDKDMDQFQLAIINA